MSKANGSKSGKLVKRSSLRKSRAREALKKALNKARYFKALAERPVVDMHLPPA